MRRKKKYSKVRRAFEHRRLHGLVRLVDFFEQARRSGSPCIELGSSSISDPDAHVARVKKAMGIQPSHLDAMWAFLGDSDASLYVGYVPGKVPSRIDTLDWLNQLADVLAHLSRETQKFIDRLFTNMIDSMERKGIVVYSVPEPD